MNNLSPALMGYLRSWYDTTARNKHNDGVVVELTFPQFLTLFSKKQLRTLQDAIDANRLRYLQDIGNQLALVATWKSYAACSSNVWSVETATICSRNKSATINLPQAGDKLRPQHCENISKSLTGLEKSEEHKTAISEATKGKSKAAWTPERRAARSAQRKAQEAAKRAAKQMEKAND